jgi:hypothetical protein
MEAVLDKLCTVLRNIILILGMGGTFGCSIMSTSTPHPAQIDLELAVREFYEVVEVAYAELDDSELERVSVGEALEGYQISLTLYEETVSVRETRNIEVDILFFTEEEAIVQAHYEHRDFSLDMDTGERNYGPNVWFTRKDRLTLVKIDDAWKVEDVEVICWNC